MGLVLLLRLQAVQVLNECRVPRETLVFQRFLAPGMESLK